VRGIQPDYRPLAKNLLGRIERQALHAQQLRFSHPETQEMMTFEAPLPVDLAGVVEVLEAERI
jgi:23S rRNA pseudouridine1911/1915/1917 synthase